MKPLLSKITNIMSSPYGKKSHGVLNTKMFQNPAIERYRARNTLASGISQHLLEQPHQNYK